MTKVPIFTDEDAPPTEDAILEGLGRAGPAWRALFDRIHATHPDLRETWKYYADGGSWLLNVSRGAKTVCWVSVMASAFRVGFYFPERLTPALLARGLSAACKAEIRRGAPSGKLRRVSVEFGPKSGIADVMQLIESKRTLR